jgi:hypothetical protein
MIHPSHSRKDLIEIIEMLDLWIDITLKKHELSEQLCIQLGDIEKLPDYTDFFDFKDKNDLKVYLSNPTPKNIVPSLEKHIVYDKIRNIIYYCKGANYLVHSSNYNHIKDIIKDAEYISTYGDEPSVRRALRLLEKDNKIKDIIKPKLSIRAKKRLHDKNRIKSLTRPRMKIHKGTFVILFPD